MKKRKIPKMRNTIPTSEKAPYKYIRIIGTIKPKQSASGENEQNWHNCDHMSSGGGN